MLYITAKAKTTERKLQITVNERWKISVLALEVVCSWVLVVVTANETAPLLMLERWKISVFELEVVCSCVLVVVTANVTAPLLMLERWKISVFELEVVCSCVLVVVTANETALLLMLLGLLLPSESKHDPELQLSVPQQSWQHSL